ncbi:MAG: nucleotidyltransferase family protein [Aquincola sp.]|nr:nucleotidyltransferase family protein [Aquincola sp.]
MSASTPLKGLRWQGSFESIPQAPRAHLRSAVVRSEAQHADLIRELDLIGRAVAETGVRPMLVGGAAHVAAGSLCAMGRDLTAIRLIVPTEHMPRTEAALMARGWTSIHHDPYQRQFHRRWMNGPAPLLHVQRHSVVLLRDRALSGRAGQTLTAPALEASAVQLDRGGLATPGPVDLALCTMAQLYSATNPDTAWRNLSDLDLLLRHLGSEPGFWTELPRRARELALARPLRHGLRWTAKLLGTPIPMPVFVAATRGMSRPISDAIWASALGTPSDTEPVGRLAGWARSAFLYRGLRLRMPMLPVLVHLASDAQPLPSKRAG